MGPPDLLDVLIVGAGLSGIGAARHLQQRCPTLRFAIVEARERLGGTWDLFRYPGVRSDSDMHTLGYAFKPWRAAQAIAGGPAILAYIQEAADEAGLTPQIQFGQRVTHAAWDPGAACWTVTLQPSTGGPTHTRRARWLYLCSGYYRYDRGHRPDIPGEADFQGRVLHPQFWPADTVLAGQRVVVVGSGATAVTLVPELARQGAQVTMLQRSPTYVMSRPAQDRLANRLAALLPARWAYGLTRWKNVLLGLLFFQFARRRPAAVKRWLVDMARRQLPGLADAAAHFTPRYNPWDQRLCLVPDGDLFRELRAGRAEVVTAEIERFTPQGLKLAGGRELPAHTVVLATGLELQVLGGIQFSVGGQPFEPAQAMAYKGMMLSGLPNVVMAFGYTNASWTLKADLTAGWFCRLQQHMARHGHAVAVAPRDPAVAEAPFLDFSSGYVQRALQRLPHQGTRAPWRVHQNYALDWLAMRWAPVNDGVLVFPERGTMPAARRP